MEMQKEKVRRLATANKCTISVVPNVPPEGDTILFAILMTTAAVGIETVVAIEQLAPSLGIADLTREGEGRTLTLEGDREHSAIDLHLLYDAELFRATPRILLPNRHGRAPLHVGASTSDDRMITRSRRQLLCGMTEDDVAVRASFGKHLPLFTDLRHAPPVLVGDDEPVDFPLVHEGCPQLGATVMASFLELDAQGFREANGQLVNVSRHDRSP